jgi:hypothetical protein
MERAKRPILRCALHPEVREIAQRSGQSIETASAAGYDRSKSSIRLASTFTRRLSCREYTTVPLISMA